MVSLLCIYYITERSVRWYYGFSIAAASARRLWRREHSNSTNIQPISFKFYMRVDTPLRYFAIEIWYPPMTRTTAFAAKRHSYPPNLKNAISPYLMVRLLSNFIQRWSTWSYIKKCQWLDQHPNCIRWRHLYPPNLQNAISPQVMVRLLSNFIQRWRIRSYIKKLSMTRLTPKLHSLTTLASPKMQYLDE